MSAGRFPQRIKRGSCVVTIYRTPTKGYDAFTVVLCIKDLRLRLDRVAKAFPCPLADVTSEAIDKFGEFIEESEPYRHELCRSASALGRHPLDSVQPRRHVPGV